MKIAYAAFDGKIFDSEVECQKYEELFKSDIHSELELYDIFGKRMPNNSESLETCEYINIKTERAFNFLKSLNEDIHVEIPDTWGLWYWEDSWISLEDYLRVWEPIRDIVYKEISNARSF